MSDQALLDAFGGVILAQVMLIRLLEERGVLAPQEFQDRLSAHLDGVAPERLSEPMYGPMKAMMQTLAKGMPSKKAPN